MHDVQKFLCYHNVRFKNYHHDREKVYGRTGKSMQFEIKALRLIVFAKILDLQEEDRSNVSERQGCENLFGRL